MEEQKPQPAAAAHQIDGAAATANVAAGVHMQEAVAADRERPDDATVRDEALAHALHMEDLMEMTESQLRGASPSFIPTGGQIHFTAFSGTGGQDRFGRQDPYANSSGASAVRQDPFANFSSAGVVPVEYPFANFSETSSRDPFSFSSFSGIGFQEPFSGAGDYSGDRAQDLFGTGAQDPFANFSRTSGSRSRNSAGAQAITETDSLPRYDDYDDVLAPSSSARPSRGVITRCVASRATCSLNAATALARPIVPVEDVVSSKRRSLLADADAKIMFAGMAEEHDNGWYESIISDAANAELEQMEELVLRESLRQCLPTRYDYEATDNTTAVAAGEEERELCLQKFCNKWNICLSDLAPDEPGPSTKRAKVPALADDEVPKFDCGICMETLDIFDLFHGMLCKHKFCTACMEAYVEGRIREGNLPIPCPDPACKGEDDGILHPEKCKKAIDFSAFGDWGVRLTERALPANRRAYCPNRRCGIMLETSGEQKPAKAPCPACKHLLCAACGMEWSADGSGKHDCAKGPDAALVMKLAAERRWKQCPRCKMIVERIDGCNTMTCRCHCVFCYRCGRPLTPPQAEEVGGEPCRCNHAGLAFAFAHQHQVHIHFPGEPGDGHGAAAADDDLHIGDGGDPAQQQDEI